MLKRCFNCFGGEQRLDIRYLRNVDIMFIGFSLMYACLTNLLFLYCDLIEFSAQRNRDYPWDIYTLKELVSATNNFHNDNKIGEGGFGSVYWGRTSKGIEAINSLSFLLSPFPLFIWTFYFMLVLYLFVKHKSEVVLFYTKKVVPFHF